jgi:hypothetical protein
MSPMCQSGRKYVQQGARAGIPALLNLPYATNLPKDVTTVRGAPIFLKPAHPEEIVKALALLTGGSSGARR